MAGSLVVAGYRDGRRVKGVTLDFLPTREAFHVQCEGGEVVEIRVRDLKSVFFVRDLAGNSEERHRSGFDPSATLSGRRIRVVYYDGEELYGTTQGYSSDRSGFFVVPSDKQSNNQRIFVIASSATQIHLL